MEITPSLTIGINTVRRFADVFPSSSLGSTYSTCSGPFFWGKCDGHYHISLPRANSFVAYRRKGAKHIKTGWLAVWSSMVVSYFYQTPINVEVCATWCGHRFSWYLDRYLYLLCQILSKLYLSVGMIRQLWIQIWSISRFMPRLDQVTVSRDKLLTCLNISQFTWWDDLYCRYSGLGTCE